MATLEYNNDITGNNQYQISDTEREYLTKHGETSVHLIISKIAQISSMYSEPYKKFCFQFDKWNEPVSILAGEWDEKVRDNQELAQMRTDNPKQFYSQMLRELKEFCTKEKVETSKGLKELCDEFKNDYADYLKRKPTFTSASHTILEENKLKNKQGKIANLLLESMSLDELSAIQIDFRKELLSILSAIGDTDDDSEKAIVRLINNVNDNEVDEVLNMLKQPNIINSDKPILNGLVDEVQDAILGFWGADNFKNFNKAIIRLISKSPTFKQKVKSDNLFYVSHGYTSIFMRAFEAALRADDYPIGTQRMDIELTDKANLLVQVEEVIGRKATSVGGVSQSSAGAIVTYDTSKSIWEPKPSVTLDPFEPVVYVNNNDLGMLADWTKGEEYTLPALFLHYADTKATNETIADASMAAIDLLGLATGYGELKLGVTGIRKFWVVADMLNSGVNLSANMTSLDDNPDVKPFLDFYNMATAASTVTRIVTSTKAANALDIKGVKLDDVDIDFAKKLNTFNSNDYAIDGFTDGQLSVFRRHFDKLNKEAAARGTHTNIETASKKALEKIDARLMRNVDKVASIPSTLKIEKNIIRGSSTEYSLAKKKLKEYIDGETYKIQQMNLPKGEQDIALKELQRRNKAYMEGKIGNINLSNSKIRVSGEDFTEKNIFTAYKVDKVGGINTVDSWLRNADTEYVMLSEIADQLGAVKGKVYPHITGEIKIVSELPYCVSCQGVIQDFSEMFPNVKIVLIDNLKY
ncbi:deaminase domain-containing protein [Dysgonomonas sp. 25]|uniref:deaminase domain-containing protein n=1 Tax=Dysgonomonas sp. 25 TaxID=2302933 RepID=UPI001C86F1C2|nr:deaminase domain-containing protein [Dysgonomonas sp. 25]